MERYDGQEPTARPLIMLPRRRPGESKARYRRRRRDVAIGLCAQVFSVRYLAVAFSLSPATVREAIERSKLPVRSARRGVRPAHPKFSQLPAPPSGETTGRP